MTIPIQHMSLEDLVALVDERRDALRTFIDWAEHRETTNRSMYLANRRDILDAGQAAAMYPEEWWGVVVFTCFGTLNSTHAVLGVLAKPVDPGAEKLLLSVDFIGPKVGNHRKRPGLGGAKTALIEACQNSSLLHKILHGQGNFHDRYQCLLAAKMDQWGRTTCFDLLVRAGALGIGGQHYQPEIAYLAESTGPKAGFCAVWGRDVTTATARWCEGLLQAWHRHWTEVVDRVGARWSGRPYGPGDLENALCIYQEGSNGGPSCEAGGGR